MERIETLIAGGGLAGLTAGAHLGDSSLVLEKDGIPGGLLQSPTRDGFTIDLVPHVFFTREEQATRLFEETVGEGRFFRKPSDIRVYSHERLTRFPFQCSLYGLPTDVVVECLYEFANAQANPPGTVADFNEFVMASFGKGIAKHFLVPYNTKLWGVSSLDELTADWVGGKVITTDLRDVIEGAISDRRFTKLPNETFRYPCHGGIETLGLTMADRVPNLKLRTQIDTIDFDRKVALTADGTEYAYSALLYTLPLPALPRYAAMPLPDEVRKACEALRYRDVYGIHFGIGREKIVDWHWMYYPEHIYPFYRVSFPSNMSPHTVPHGTSSIIAEVAVNPTDEVDTEQLLERCLDGLRKSGVVRRDDPVLMSAAHRLSPAYVVYDKHRNAAVDCITDFLGRHDVVTAGRFGEWRFFNMDHTMLSALRAVRQIEKRLA